jgi:hypothetical protein
MQAGSRPRDRLLPDNFLKDPQIVKFHRDITPGNMTYQKYLSTEYHNARAYWACGPPLPEPCIGQQQGSSLYSKSLH